MHMTIGIKEDLKIKTENIMLYRFNDVFFPDNSYYNSDPLPVEWIEVFQENQTMEEGKDNKVALKDLDKSKEISLFPKEDEKIAIQFEPRGSTRLNKDFSVDKLKSSKSKNREKPDEDGQMEINGTSQATIKKTLEIYSVISNVNKGMLKNDLSGIEEEKPPEETQLALPLLAIDDKPYVELSKNEEPTAEDTPEASNDKLAAKALATVEEDEKMLDEQLSTLNKREKMICQLQSSVSKNSYRKWEKQAEQFKGSNTRELDSYAYNKEK